jgi:hypothetical protein
VDPKLIFEQTGLSFSSAAVDEGADYLRRMKEQTTEPSPEVAVSSERMEMPAGKERRRSPRFRCNGSAEFRVDGNDIRMWGTLCDVSLHGCYVEMNNTFPVDTRVNLVLEVLGVRAQMPAVVRVSYPFLGMGLCFSEIEPGQQVQLEQLLATVSGSVSPSASDSSQTASRSSPPSLGDVDLQVMVAGLAEFFRKNVLLSRDEFYEIARQARR